MRPALSDGLCAWPPVEKQTGSRSLDNSAVDTPYGTETFFKFLFVPDEHVVIRYQQADGIVRTFFRRGHDPSFWNKTVPALNKLGAIVWAGVCPRVEPDSGVVLHGRALWCDFSAEIVSVDEAMAAIVEAELPDPHMVVWSGYGVHAYWRLDKPYPPEMLRPRLIGLHERLPTDATYDPTRVMGIPGTINFKDPSTPRPRKIVSYREGHNKLEDFPKAVQRDIVTQEIIPTSKIPLSDTDRDTILDELADGQKHHVLLGFAAYLRKKLGYSESEAREEIELLLTTKGYEMDRGAEKLVSDTYEKAWSQVSTEQLVIRGIKLSSAETQPVSFKSARKEATKPIMRIVNIQEESPSQEFWMPGLVGPGLFTLWAAPTKVGKSYAAMQIAYGLATGTQVWDFPVSGRHPTLYFQGELSYAMVHQRARDVFPYLPTPEQLALTEKPDNPINLLKEPEILMDMAANYECIVVDPISVFSTNGNDNDAVNETIGLFSPLIAAGKSVIVVQHMRKLGERPDGTPRTPTAEDIRGAGQWFARPDAIAVHAPQGRNRASVSFTFRAAPDRSNLSLWRMPNGAWTDSRDTWMRTQPGMVGKTTLPSRKGNLTVKFN